MYAALAANAGHPAVAALLGLGAAGLAGAVVAMAWTVHARQIRLAEQLARRQFLVMAEPGAGHHGAPADADTAGRANGTAPTTPGHGTMPPAGGSGPAGVARAGAAPAAAGQPGPAAGNGGQSPPVVIDGPDTVVAGDQARYRVR